MGCDIHGTIEVQQTQLGGGDGLWYTTVKLDRILRRSYDHFAHLFGVRHYPGDQSIDAAGYESGMEPKCLYAERGFPHDAADATVREHDEWGPDAHSETWAYQDEIAGAMLQTELMDDERWSTAVEIGDRLQDSFHDTGYMDGTVRWVVWFDN